MEVQHAITSLSAPRAEASRLLPFWREHWHIENKLHWVRDVTLGEDGCRVKLGHGPQNLAACRNAPLHRWRLEGLNGIAATLPNYASRPWELLKLLCILKH